MIFKSETKMKLEVHSSPHQRVVCDRLRGVQFLEEMIIYN